MNFCARGKSAEPKRPCSRLTFSGKRLKLTHGEKLSISGQPITAGHRLNFPEGGQGSETRKIAYEIPYLWLCHAIY
jgi:hypothetical protein